jgi:hypothetical protein
MRKAESNKGSCSISIAKSYVHECSGLDSAHNQEAMLLTALVFYINEKT